MSSYNRVVLIGNLGRDPETRYAPNGDAITSFSVATSEAWKDKATGEKKEETTWHSVQAFGRTAEVAGEYLRKGAKCLVEGRYRSRKYTTKDGDERTVYEVICDRLVLLGSREASGGGGGEEERPMSQRAPSPAPAAARKPASSMADLDNDIPF